MRLRAILSNKWTKVVVLFVGLVPFVLLAIDALTGKLGINPVETLQHSTGDWTLRFLVLSLCVRRFESSCPSLS